MLKGSVPRERSVRISQWHCWPWHRAHLPSGKGCWLRGAAGSNAAWPELVNAIRTSHFTKLNHSPPLESGWHFQSKFAQLSANSTSGIWKSSCALSASHRRGGISDKLLLTKSCPQLRLCNPGSVRLTGIQSKLRGDKGNTYGSGYTQDWFVSKGGDTLRLIFQIYSNFQCL